jgi:hypothetical protein
MIKATATGKDGRSYLLVGLSHANLDRLRADGTSGFIKIVGAEMGLPVDVIITAGETEASLASDLAELIGPDTKVHVSEKLKQ